MRILPALSNTQRFVFTGNGGQLFFDKSTSKGEGTTVIGFICSSFSGEGLGFQLSLADVIGLQGYFNRAEGGFATGPDDYIEIVAGRRFVFSLSWRAGEHSGVTVVMTDMQRESGKRMIAMIELGEPETRKLREMVKALPCHAAHLEAISG